MGKLGERDYMSVLFKRVFRIMHEDWHVSSVCQNRWRKPSNL